MVHADQQRDTDAKTCPRNPCKGCIRRKTTLAGHWAWGKQANDNQSRKPHNLEACEVKILCGCEFSGQIRDAFSKAGHDAISCDLLATEMPGKHVIGDVLEMLNQDWDLAIFNPPCTYLCNSGVRWLAPGGKLNAERHALMQSACDFFAALYWADIPRVAIENPVMHKYARDYLHSSWKIHPRELTARQLRSGANPVFSIQPWQHGEPEVKRTCFWTRNLPALVPSNIVAGRTARVHRASPGPNRWKERSRTLPGVAKAIAMQWGNQALPRP